ncbi:hypothetical protein C2S52_009182 [Perilla frutescens var. hirtella]|uniref:Uncharacterized protein n=1 Tax=Perilla frutescens var. hirtella TaxID=608512 RepID=A0AAD4JQH9_PERFH|nr:hypothetical protein C2S51_017303 [Perilla frutescens var. frutescens]KAH6784223.1 hypothetical protein C2S52_009182 [Perilla frutescens var. hirtella]KAH6838142.1 hypothetical protein C2S53_001233 [Perilla frutescens var. hirtella]
MHLWPSGMLRDSFKQKLLETDENDSEPSGCGGGIAVIFSEIFMILSCCYCCFCCGACIPDEESS